ncbi:NIPSNAP family protein [Zavarzinella formosa]|uniref:NIPSNAP family protein n=1 Tax=Zavarzinella formosa TaxID=360055 RepID=UPI0002DC155D|nr:NIPSNAP family protein [Zavarzinella formosa]
MERRTFVQASVATLCATAAGFAAEPKPETPELFELRTYTLKPGKQPLLDDYLAKAYLPALKKLGIGPVGVFVEPPEKELLRVYVLVVHKTAESVATLPAKLTADEEYQKAASAYLAAKADDPVYQRIESSLLTAISGMPKLEKPDATKPRLLNLRIYESHNERGAAKKVEMFEKGELAIFKKVGLTPVFFASSLVGAAMPNLTYLLVFPDEAGRKSAWDTFRVAPEWLKLKAIPEYADKEIVSKITNKILTPAAYSEI